MNPQDVEISKGIVTNPHRCGGTPTVRGTRIPAYMVAELASYMDPFEIITDYPTLTYADIANARGWERKGMRR